MRDTKFRTRLFLCFLAVIVMTLVLPGLYVRKNIKEDGIDETVRNARREAVLIRMQMETAPDGVHGLSSTFDRIARSSASASPSSARTGPCSRNPTPAGST